MQKTEGLKLAKNKTEWRHAILLIGVKGKSELLQHIAITNLNGLCTEPKINSRTT